MSLAPGRAQDQDVNSNILAHLNAVITWYKNLGTRIPPGQEPSDTIYLSNAEALSAEAIRLAFQSARAQSALNATQAPTGTPNENWSENTSGAQKYAQMAEDVAKRIADDESQIEDLKQKASKSNKKNAADQLQSLEGKLELDKATLDTVQQMKKFVESTNAGGTGLERSINELARSVPEVFAPAPTPTTTTNAPSNKTATQTPQPTPTKTAPSDTNTGLISQLTYLYEQTQSIRAINDRLVEIDKVRKIATDLRTPLRTELVKTLQQGKDLVNQGGVSKQQYDALTRTFKQLSAAMLPLSEELLVLDQSQSNLTQWKKARENNSRALLISILTRVGFILGTIALIFGLAEAWRRLTFRYVHDPRRRRQFLVLRRFVMGFFIFLAIVMGFVSEFSSLATFAGFVTAGIAVGLQTVLLSVAAYFFVVGRYGIRVGDRISVAGVTGDVIELGLVRFYLMEYAQAGSEYLPTGRVAVFSNSVLFQATTPLYKQLPGARYVWHEAVLPLNPGANYGEVQKSFYDVVHTIYADYSKGADWRDRSFDPQMEIPLVPPALQQRLQFGDTGVESVVRYPVDLHRTAEIDDRIAKELVEAIQKNQIAAASVGTPKIRAALKT